MFSVIPDFNEDGKKDIDDIYALLTYYIGLVDKKNEQGAEKKQMVLEYIKKLLSNETYERFYPMLDKSIDFIVLLSKKREILDTINKTSKRCYKLCCS